MVRAGGEGDGSMTQSMPGAVALCEPDQPQRRGDAETTTEKQPQMNADEHRSGAAGGTADGGDSTNKGTEETER